LEQESYELKRQIESMRNEYEAKIYELAEDLHLLNKKLSQRDNHEAESVSRQIDENEQLDLIQELKEKNLKLAEENKAVIHFGK
jgi:hypothetical protein